MAFFSTKKSDRLEKELDPANFSSLNTTIGFSVLGLIAALLFTTVVDLQANNSSENLGIDPTIVGSISKKNKTKRYTVRRSVLQKAGENCIIQANGSRRGNC
ncbi:MAG: hypothetical protein V3V04_00775 [Rhizobiaceae bacterium]